MYVVADTDQRCRNQEHARHQANGQHGVAAELVHDWKKYNRHGAGWSRDLVSTATEHGRNETSDDGGDDSGCCAQTASDAKCQS
jgi:hypothetical protein